MTQRVVNYTYGTGNPVLPDGSIDVRDGIDNLQSFDIFMNADEDAYNQRDGEIVKTRAGAVRDIGVQRIGDFTTGCTVTARNQGVLYETDGTVYVWLGALPKAVPAASSPATTGGIGPDGWLDVGDASAYSRISSELSAPDGASLVGGVQQEFNTVDDMKAFPVVVGRTYRTIGYRNVFDGGGASYYAESSGLTPDGHGDHTASNGVYLRLASQPTDLNHGVRLGAFAAADAWHNRNAIQAMLRNSRWSYFELAAKGEYYILGSVHPLRDDLYVNHKQGCAIIGRYNDSSIPASFTSQSGGMFGFVKYQDPDNGNFNVVSDIHNITYQLDGSVATEYNASHAATHNNNCIGFYRANESVVKGVGGVNSSDHRGINFDGDAVNCRIDVAYVKGTMDEPLVMKGSPTMRNRCSVRVGRISNVPFGGPNPTIAVRVDGGFDIQVDIGSFEWDGITKPQLVGAFNCETVRVNAGFVNGVTQIVRQYETLDVEATVNNIRNSTWGVVRAGVATGRMRSAKLCGVKSVDSAFLYPYRADSNQDTFTRLTICDNDFSGAGAGFQYYNGRTTPGLPAIYDLHDNISPAGFTVVDFNRLSSGYTANLATAGSTSLVVNYKSPDWVYGMMTIIVQVSGANYAVDLDLRARSLTSTSIGLIVSTATISTRVSGSNMTITVTGGTLQIVTMHN